MQKATAMAPHQNKKTVQSVLGFLGQRPVVSSMSLKARADARLQMAMSTGGLNAAQRAVVISIMDGENVFLTGRAVARVARASARLARTNHGDVY
jgi:hypothetical protein